MSVTVATAPNTSSLLRSQQAPKISNSARAEFYSKVDKSKILVEEYKKI